MNLVNIEIFGYQFLFDEKKKQDSYTSWLTFFDISWKLKIWVYQVAVSLKWPS